MDQSQSTNFYLERVGFEVKVNFRHNLKPGNNTIGRSDTQGVDIGINSFMCSRNHCVISVTGDSVSIKDMNSSNGTIINGQKIKGESLSLQENDLIGIVGGLCPLSELTGNHNFIVYRLRKYTSENIQTFEIDDDDDPIELSDNDEDNIICLDSDGEPVDNIKEEHDLDMQLSWNFNNEIKKEMEDLDDGLEAMTVQMKTEPNDSQPDEWNEFPDQSEDDLSEMIETIVNPEQDVQLNNVPDHDNDSNDSTETICFSKIQEQSNEDAAPSSDNANNETEAREIESKLKDAVSRVKDCEEKKVKRVSEIIHPKPLEKRRKTKIERTPKCESDKLKIKSDRKEKLKAVASPKTKVHDDEKEATTSYTTPKVKFTPNNRGAFLTDMAQLPALPRVVKKKPKAKVIEHSISTPKPPGEPLLASIPTPPELEQKICESMYPKEVRMPPNNQKQVESKRINGDNVPVTIIPGSDNKNGDSTNHQNEDVDEHLDSYMDIDENKTNDKVNGDDDDDDDVDVNFLKILMNLPPETGTVEIIETVPKPKDLKSILKTASSVATKKRTVSFKETCFQQDPCHKVISDITAYDYAQHESVDNFCRSADKNVPSFADSYEQYDDYRTTLTSLMLVELWTEIEMEYINSKIRGFTTVTVNYEHLERRGDGHRMVFHCQADSLYKSQAICDGHLVFVKCKRDEYEVEFLAFITDMRYASKEANQKFAHFSMETSALTEVLSIKSLDIRPITVITNTLNNFKAIHNLKRSPLVNSVIDPLSVEIQSQQTPDTMVFKTYDPLDDTQRRILGSLYRRCIKLDVPNISLLDGASGTGKTCLIANLALQLVYGDELPKPLRILICTNTNGSANDLTRKLIKIRDNTKKESTKIKLVRFGLLENMDKFVSQVAVQNLKELNTSYERLVLHKKTLELKILAKNLSDSADRSSLQLFDRQLKKVNALLERFDGFDKKKLRDSATFILNTCDIICTTFASIPKLQSYVSHVDVCIIDEATQCSEPSTLLPFQFGMPSVVLVGDSQLVPLAPYTRALKEKNYGNSLFSRFQKLFLGKFGSPVFEMNFQYRVHHEILMWPNCQFYKNRLVPHAIVKDDSFPIAPYKIISYGLGNAMKESDAFMLFIKVLLGHVDWQAFTFGVICSNFKQKSILKNRLRDYQYITTNTADSYVGERDVIIIWISEEHGIGHLAHQQILNTSVTRAKKSLLICGANLTAHKNRPVWRSLLENANSRKCLQHLKVLTAPKICSILTKNNLKCAICA